MYVLNPVDFDWLTVTVSWRALLLSKSMGAVWWNQWTTALGSAVTVHSRVARNPILVWTTFASAFTSGTTGQGEKSPKLEALCVKSQKIINIFTLNSQVDSRHCWWTKSIVCHTFNGASILPTRNFHKKPPTTLHVVRITGIVPWTSPSDNRKGHTSSFTDNLKNCTHFHCHLATGVRNHAWRICRKEVVHIWAPKRKKTSCTVYAKGVGLSFSLSQIHSHWTSMACLWIARPDSPAIWQMYSPVSSSFTFATWRLPFIYRVILSGGVNVGFPESARSTSSRSHRMYPYGPAM